MSEQIKINKEKIKQADIIVGIPSYNEADNIAFVAEQALLGLKKYFPKLKAVIINVDNNSEDGTKEAFLNAKTKVPKIYISTPKGITGKGNNFYNLFKEMEALDAQASIVIDADIKSVTPEWIEYLGKPILEKNKDFVTPLYARNEYDGTITNNICYPLIASVLGIEMRQPIGGDFSFSRKLSDHLLKQRWTPTIKHYGIDIFMTINAITGGFKMCQVGLGQKIHKPSAPKLGPMFTQVVDTLFDLLLSNRDKWEVQRETTPLPIYGKNKNGKPQDLAVSYKGIKETSIYEFNSNRKILSRFLSKSVFEELDKMYKKEKINITADLWSKIIFDALHSYDITDIDGDLVEALKALYFGRSLTFIRDTMDMSFEESEKEIQKQMKAFVKNKKYFLAKYQMAPTLVDSIARRILNETV